MTGIPCIPIVLIAPTVSSSALSIKTIGKPRYPRDEVHSPARFDSISSTFYISSALITYIAATRGE